MVDEETGEQVPKDDRVRGFEVGKGRSITVDQSDLDAIQVESSRAIDIDNFLARGTAEAACRSTGSPTKLRTSAFSA